MTTTQKIRVPNSTLELAFIDEGDKSHPAVVMTHSILTTGKMWEAQAALLVKNGFRVIRADTRGHGASSSLPAPYSMNDLASDTVAILDALGIAKAHYVGLSLGGMSGFGLGIDFGNRVLSLVLCGTRADMPAAAGAVWNERIDMAVAANSCAPLAKPTTERWFTSAFLSANPSAAALFPALITGTSVDGFVGTARAIQGLDYLPRAGQIAVPTTLIVGSNDGPLVDALRGVSSVIKGSKYELIEDAGHLSNIDQPAAFNAALLKHFAAFK